MVEQSVNVDPKNDQMLFDHSVKGIVVLPVVYVMNWFYEFINEKWSNAMAYELQNFSVLAGVKLGQFVDAASFTIKDDDNELKLHQDKRMVYRCKYIKCTDNHKQHITDINYNNTLSWPWSNIEIYENKILFHGKQFQVINQLLAYSDDAASALIETNYWHDGRLVDRPMLDGGLQLACLWVRAQLNKASLPMAVEKIRIYRSAQSQKVLCYLNGIVKDKSRCKIDLVFVEDGVIIAELLGVDMLTYRE